MHVKSATPKRVRIGENLYERPSRRKGGEPNYLVVVRVGGRQYSKALSAHNRTAAREETKHVLSALLTEIHSTGPERIAPGDEGVTLGALARDYLAKQSGPTATIKPSTLELRRILLDRHVLPHFGEETLASAITAASVRRFVETLIERKLSGSYIREAVGTLSSVLDHGCRNESLEENVTRRLVKGDLPSAKRRTEPRYLEPAQVGAVLSELSEEYRPVAAALFFGAMRVSEALALRWEHVDFERGALHVPGTKTRSSDAEIPLHPRLAEILRTHRAKQVEVGVQRITSHALIFQTTAGTEHDRRNVLRAINRASIRAGLVEDGQEKVGAHDLRHSAASAAFAAGWSPVEVARFLRHATPAVTLTTYARVAGDHVKVLAPKVATLGVA